MTEPTLTVFLPNYNHGRYLPEALRSIADQSYRPLEIIIVDDASTDNSVEIIERFAKSNPHVRFIRNEVNRGVVYNEEMALKLATGTHFFGVSADDRIRPGFFEKTMDLLAQHPEAGFCSSMSYTIDEKGDNVGVYPTPMVAREPCYLSPGEVLETLRRIGPWFMGNATIWRRTAMQESLDAAKDLGPFYDGFLSQLLALRCGTCFIPEPLGEFRRVRGQMCETTYDAPAAFPIYRRAIELMRTTYRDVFPEDYVKLFERRTLAYTMERSLAGAKESHLSLMKTMVAPSRRLARVCLAPIWLAMQLQFVLAKIWLVVFVRREFWKPLGRAIKHLAGFGLPGTRRRGR